MGRWGQWTETRREAVGDETKSSGITGRVPSENIRTEKELWPSLEGGGKDDRKSGGDKKGGRRRPNGA